jgi:hypothetical protein
MLTYFVITFLSLLVLNDICSCAIRKHRALTEATDFGLRPRPFPVVFDVEVRHSLDGTSAGRTGSR